MTQLRYSEVAAVSSTSTGPYLTNGIIAMTNLQAQIKGWQWEHAEGRLLGAAERAELIDLVALRGHILGCIADYEWADASAEQLVLDAPEESAAFLTRARSRSRLHLFQEALADLDEAKRSGADVAVIEMERAGIFQATGQFEPAFDIYSEAVERQGDFHSRGALAILQAERGELAAAERLFAQSCESYRGVSPFPFALLEFQRGLMWVREGSLTRALAWFDAAVRCVAAYAPAQGELAEVEAALGATEAAIRRLLPLARSSDDPEYAAALAGVLLDCGRVKDGSEWRDRAAARFDELLTRRPEAYADHAAEFWLKAGADPDRALSLARMNLELRRTPRAEALLTRASAAVGSTMRPGTERSQTNRIRI